MLVLTAAVVAVSVLCLADLLLTFGVIRRLRQHSALLASRGDAPVATRLSIGESPGPFTAVTTDGVDLTSHAGFRIAAFFSATCSICPGRVPTFIDYLQANQVAHHEVLAVVLAGESDSVPYLDQLTDAGRVCVQPADGNLATAFKVGGYPAFCLLNQDGTVRASSFTPADLPQLVAA